MRQRGPRMPTLSTYSVASKSESERIDMSALAEPILRLLLVG
jgi:hypothetical protein